MSNPDRGRSNRVATDEERIKKFVERANFALTGPVFEISKPPKDDGFEITGKVTHKPDGIKEFQLDMPDITMDELILSITKCRTFLLPSEDNHLPGVLAAMERLFPNPRWGVVHESLRKDVGAALQGKNLKQNSIFTGLWRDGVPPTPESMVGDAEIAMHFIYGKVLHEDEWRREALDEIGMDQFVQLMVIMQINLVMRWAHTMRHMIGRMERGEFPPDGPLKVE